MTQPETSIIIRTFNEEKYLPGLLDGIREQTYQNFEVVVVDSGSFDRTREIAATADKLLRITSHDFTFGYSLNVGIEAASGEYAVLVSAHTLPADGEWLGRLVQPLQENTTAMSYGRQLGWATSKYSEILDLSRTFGTKPRLQQPPDFFAHNANSAIRRSLWSEHRFDETLSGLEDIEWAKYWMERGYQVAYEPMAALHHIHEENWHQIKNRYYREALAARGIGIKHRRDAILEVAKEAAYTVWDLGRAVAPAFKGSKPGKRVAELSKEVILFRTHKAAGTLQGLFDGATMQDPRGKESVFFDRTSASVVVQGPGRASVERVPIPTLKPGDVLIRTAYTGVCGTDLEIFDGTSDFLRDGSARYPVVPGRELSGRVVMTGTNVSHLTEGQAVAIESFQNCGVCQECRQSNFAACNARSEMGVAGHNGGYSQYVLIPGRFAHSLPSGLDLARAALCQPLASVVKGLSRLSRCWPEAPQTKRCAVVGVGSVGHLCALALANQGHQVTAFDRDSVRLSYFQSTNIETSGDLSLLSQFDVLVEMTGDPEALEAILHHSPPGATVLLLGLPYAHRQFTFDTISEYDKTVVGSVGSTSEDFEQAIGLLPKLDLAPYLDCVMPLENYLDAWDLFRKRTHLKLLLKPDNELI